MKKLPVGIQDFAKIINEDYLYVDKTKFIFNLLQGSYYFLSRPRRFGKSLLISTLKEFFSGNKELFRNLWIYDKVEFKKHPVIHFDFSKSGHKELGAEKAISNMLQKIAEEYQVTLTEKVNGLKLNELIVKLSEKEKVVLLIDEYDKPIIDHLEDFKQANENREILRNLFSVIKGNDANIRFCFFTGVSKFAKVSVFSELNNLYDITIHDTYSTMLGYTQAELNFYFDEKIKLLQQKYAGLVTDIHTEIKHWYNGYSWNAKDFVYNPFSILKLFGGLSFQNYWFASGTPTFLVKLIRNHYLNLEQFSEVHVSATLLDASEIENISAAPLLLQTGYLTMKSYDFSLDYYTLSYPNREVEASFNQHLLIEFTEKKGDFANSVLFNLQKSLKTNKLPEFIENVKALYAGISYNLIEQREKYYHSIFYTIMRLLGFMIECEMETNIGRIDAVIKTDKFIYILEFKMGDAKTAMAQIKANNYVQKYVSEGKEIILFGIGFDAEAKNVGSWETEIFS